MGVLSEVAAESQKLAAPKGLRFGASPQSRPHPDFFGHVKVWSLLLNGCSEIWKKGSIAEVLASSTVQRADK